MIIICTQLLMWHGKIRCNIMMIWRGTASYLNRMLLFLQWLTGLHIRLWTLCKVLTSEMLVLLVLTSTAINSSCLPSCPLPHAFLFDNLTEAAFHISQVVISLIAESAMKQHWFFIHWFYEFITVTSLVNAAKCFKRWPFKSHMQH